MEIYQLKAFVTAARLGNLTRTAEVLHLTQPAITAQIKALEEELGVPTYGSKHRMDLSLMPDVKTVVQVEE
mgnify:CR=1 FL=1